MLRPHRVHLKHGRDGKKTQTWISLTSREFVCNTSRRPSCSGPSCFNPTRFVWNQQPERSGQHPALSQSNEGSSGTPSRLTRRSSTRPLQPHEGSSGTVDDLSLSDVMKSLQPHEGSSGTQFARSTIPPPSSFNPTRVRLEPARTRLQPAQGPRFNPTRVRLERLRRACSALDS